MEGPGGDNGMGDALLGSFFGSACAKMRRCWSSQPLERPKFDADRGNTGEDKSESKKGANLTDP